MIGLAAAALAAEHPLLPAGSRWRYLDGHATPPEDWTEPGFDDGGWAAGPAPLGYGVAALGTSLDWGADPLARPASSVARATFEVSDPAAFEAVSLRLRRDDGAVVWVNGVEVVRDNVLGGREYATAAVSGADQDRYFDHVLPPGALHRGTNTVAVSVHNQSASSPDLVVDVAISGWDGPTAITRGPWLQQVGPSGAIVRWRTDGPGAGAAWWGDAPGALDAHAIDAAIGFDHQVTIADRVADRDVAYAVGHPDAGLLAGADADHVFHTAPLPGARRPIRLWVVGDSGTADANAEAVRDAWRARHPDPLDTDLFLMLGDNAYPSGTEAEYDEAVFGIYPDWLRQVGVWATLGNHDAYASSAATQAGPYFDLFTFPTGGELGGEASGTEAWWSFDYGNLHVVNLDSSGSDRSPAGAMATWLRADLAATDSDWLVAMFHHPPYSKGSHDSDRELELVEMRETFLPILEDAGVDLVLSGHSHSYERSYLLDGHYGASPTLEDDHVLQARSGDPAGDGAYTKWPTGRTGHEGALYAVAGSSGQVSGGPLDHPAMVVSLASLGSLGIEIDGLTLDARFYDDTARVVDRFALRKGATTIVELGGQTVGAEGEALSFRALALQRDGSEVPAYAWEWGDGSPGDVGSAATHAWAAEGVYPVLLTATDVDGVEVSDTLLVGIDNHPPEISEVSVTGDPVEGGALTFAASAVDAGGDALIYDWLIEGTRRYGSTVTATFSRDGLRAIPLTVTDDAGRSDLRELAIAVANLPPEVLSTALGDPVEGTPASLSVLARDPGGDPLAIRWRLDDAELQGAFVSHTFRRDGRYPVRIVLADDAGAETVVEEGVRVRNAAPAIDGVDVVAGPGGPAEGEPVTLRVRAHDPGPDDVLVATWALGSELLTGESIEVVVRDDAPRPPWIVRVSDGVDAVEAPIALGARNLPPRIRAVDAPGEAVEGIAVRVAVDAVDPGVDAVLAATWRIEGPGPSLGFEGLEADPWFPDEGDWRLIVEVRDDEGGASAPLTVPVRVANAAPVFASTPPAEVVGALRYAPAIEDVDEVALALVEGPPGAAVARGVLTWPGPGEARFVLRADDGDGGIAEQAFAVRSAPAPAAGCGCSAASGSSAPPLGLLALVHCARWFARSCTSRVGFRA